MIAAAARSSGADAATATAAKAARCPRSQGTAWAISGGPKFLDGNPDMIVATVTTGDHSCRATSRDKQFDTQEARGSLGQYVTLP